MEKFINKVEASGIIAFDLFDFRPTEEFVGLDIKDMLYMEMIIKEKEFKAAVKEMDFTVFTGKAVAIYCSVETVIPSWVYMVLADKFCGVAAYFNFNTVKSLELEMWYTNVLKADLSPYKDQKVVVRARPEILPALYMLATDRLRPVVKALMYGEIGMPKVIYKR